MIRSKHLALVVFVSFVFSDRAPAQDKVSTADIISAVDKYRLRIPGKRFEYNFIQTMPGTATAPINITQTVEVSEKGDDWRVEHVTDRSNKVGKVKQENAYRFDWNEKTVFMADHVDEPVILSSGKQGRYEHQGAIFKKTWDSEGMNPFTYVLGIGMFGGHHDIKCWLSESIQKAATCSIKQDGEFVVCDFIVVSDNENYLFPEWKNQLILKRVGSNLDLDSLLVTNEFHSEQLGGQTVGTRSVQFGPTSRQGEVAIVDSCEIVHTNITEGKKVLDVRDSIQIVSVTSCSLPDKLVFDSINVPDGTRVESDSNERLEYHEGEIYRMADDRSLRAIDDSRMYKPSFWKKYGTVFLVFSLMLVIGLAVLIRRSYKKMR